MTEPSVAPAARAETPSQGGQRQEETTTFQRVIGIVQVGQPTLSVMADFDVCLIANHDNILDNQIQYVGDR
jgi:hypothetical protein